MPDRNCTNFSITPTTSHAANAENWKYLDSIVLCSCNTAASFWAQGFSKSLNTNEQIYYLSENMERNNQKMIRKIKYMSRGVGTGETGEAHASPEIRGCIKSNRQEEKKCIGYSFFWGVLHLKLYCSYAPE